MKKVIFAFAFSLIICAGVLSVSEIAIEIGTDPHVISNLL